MSKTAREILTEQIIGPSPGAQINDAEVDAIIAELDAAGFVIVPKEPTEAMIDASPEEGVGWNKASRGYAARFYRSMIDAYFQEPKP